MLKVSRSNDLIQKLLENRGLTAKLQKDEFLNPIHPRKISLVSLKIAEKEVLKAKARIKKAIRKKEKIVIYGDYDCDGITATATIWEALYAMGADVVPHIPDRFKEGYGLNAKSVEALKSKNPNLKLVITVDNGIVANDAVKVAGGLGIDVIITDHHEKSKVKPQAYAVLHTTKTSGSGIAWFLARELKATDGLELPAIGTLTDQLPLLGVNRSLVKYGLVDLNFTRRPGLVVMFEEAKLVPGTIGTYAVGFVIGPRINAMGRLAEGIESLRLLCTKNKARARELVSKVSTINTKRQKIVEEVVIHAKKVAKEDYEGIIIVGNKSYHEGVIGLAAAKLVEEFWRPAIVISQGDKISKASARSIPGVSIIEIIRAVHIITTGGGHEMAAGFSIETSKIEDLKKEIRRLSRKYLTAQVLTKETKIDSELGFGDINEELFVQLKKFEPFGIGNPEPIFLSKKVTILRSRLVGKGEMHVKLVLRQLEVEMNAIFFGAGKFAKRLRTGRVADVVYSIEENNWNGKKNLELKIRDLRLSD